MLINVLESPRIYTLKAGNSLKLLIGYRVRIKYISYVFCSLAPLQNVLNGRVGRVLYSKFYIVSTFDCIEITEDCHDLTSFCFPSLESFKFKRMLSSPVLFSDGITSLANVYSQKVASYFEDIIISVNDCYKMPKNKALFERMHKTIFSLPKVVILKNEILAHCHIIS